MNYKEAKELKNIFVNVAEAEKMYKEFHANAKELIEQNMNKYVCITKNLTPETRKLVGEVMLGWKNGNYYYTLLFFKKPDAGNLAEIDVSVESIYDVLRGANHKDIGGDSLLIPKGVDVNRIKSIIKDICDFKEKENETNSN